MSIALEAAEILKKKGVEARVASIPCFEVFDQQSLEYRLSVLPAGAPVLSVEAYTVRFSCSLDGVWGGADAYWGRRLDGASTRTSRLGSTRSERRRRHLWSTRSLASLDPVSPFLLLLFPSVSPCHYSRFRRPPVPFSLPPSSDFQTRRLTIRTTADIAEKSEVVIAYYKKVGHAISSPLEKAL